MHSRSFLQRTVSTPRASADETGSAGHLPLGFADVRAQEPAEQVEHPRSPIGFAAPDQRFVTELSFRRTQPAPAAPLAHVPGPAVGMASGALGVGHASPWRSANDDADATTAPVDVPPAAEAPDDATPVKSVPFYKREITLRRRKHTAVEMSENEPVGEIVSDDEGHPQDDPAEQRTIGFAAPAEDDESVTVDEEQDVAIDLFEVVAQDSVDVLEDEPLVVLSDSEAELVEEEPIVVLSDDEAVFVDDEQPLVAAEGPLVVLSGNDEAELDENAGAEDPEPENVEEIVVLTAEDETDEIVAVATVDDPAPEDSAETDDAEADAAEGEPAVVEEPLADGEPTNGDLTPAAVDAPRRRSLRSRPSRPSSPKVARTKEPRAGGRKVVGLKIGASQLAAAVVTRTDGRDELVALARTALPAGIVVDGEVRDPEALRNALHTFFDDHKLPRRDVRIGVASNRIGVRIVDISGIDEKERFDNAVRFKAHEVLPVSFSESVLDYQVVEERMTEAGELSKRVLLVVAPRDQVEPFAAACTGAGLRLAGVDLEALGLLRTFVAPQAPGTRLATDTATVVVSIGHESSTLLVSGGGTCEFTRVFDWGGLSLQQAIAQELDLQPAEAATILHGLSLVGPGRTGLDETLRTRALDAVRTRFTPFARELVSSLQFYQAQSGSLGIGEIVITGGTSHLEGLADALHQMIGVAVRVGDPLARLVIPHTVDPELERMIGSLAVSVGLAIEDDPTRSVNLLPEELRKQRRKKPGALQVALPIAAVVPLAALGFLFMQASGDVATRQDEVAAVQAQIDALPDPTRPQIDATLAVDQQLRAAALASVLGGRLAWDSVLGDVSRVMPANVWLTKFTAMAPDPVAALAESAATPSVAAVPTGVTIEGYTYRLPDVARLLARLGAVPSLTNVSLGSSEEREIGKRKAIAFTIIADIKGNGGSK